MPTKTTTPQQNGTDTPAPQQQGGTDTPAPQQQGQQPIYRDWAAI